VELVDWMKKRWVQRKKVTYKKGFGPNPSTMGFFGVTCLTLRVIFTKGTLKKIGVVYS
jgi:hypothetical protein